MPRTAFLDEAVLEINGGCGGNGAASFRRTRRQPLGGPDGGNGGSGGSVFARAAFGISSLADYVTRNRLIAKNGAHGSSNRKHGASGSDTWIKLPIGTDIHDDLTGNLHASLLEDGNEVMLARGGQGGRGNVTFKTSTNRSPRETTLGEDGEQRLFRLSLRLLADVGLIGLPNAGKSTLLNAITNSASATGAYPFTTLRPQLGVVELEDYSQLTFTDIPGIIEGAAEGAGLGLRFLRHITRATVLLHLVDCASCDAATVLEQIAEVATELEHSEKGDLMNKPRILLLAKIDLLEEEQVHKLATLVQAQHPTVPVCCASSVTGVGLSAMIEQAAILVRARQQA